MGGSVPPIECFFRNLTRFGLPRLPAHYASYSTRTIKRVLLDRADKRRYQVGAIPVPAKRQKISRSAVGTFHTVTDAGHWRRVRDEQDSFFQNEPTVSRTQ